MTNPTVAVTAATSMASTTWRQGRWMYLRRERRREDGTLGCGRDDPQPSSAHHAGHTDRLAASAPFPEPCQAVLVLLCSLAKLLEVGDQQQEQLCPPSSSRSAHLPCTELGTAPTERLVLGDSAEPRTLRLVKPRAERFPGSCCRPLTALPPQAIPFLRPCGWPWGLTSW